MREPTEEELEDAFDALAVWTAGELKRVGANGALQIEALEQAVARYGALRAAAGEDPAGNAVRFFAEDGVALGRMRPPPLRRVPGADEEEIARWASAVASLAGAPDDDEPEER